MQFNVQKTDFLKTQELTVQACGKGSIADFSKANISIISTKIFTNTHASWIKA
jgi:hypothetical protein